MNKRFFFHKHTKDHDIDKGIERLLARKDNVKFLPGENVISVFTGNFIGKVIRCGEIVEVESAIPELKGDLRYYAPEHLKSGKQMLQ